MPCHLIWNDRCKLFLNHEVKSGLYIKKKAEVKTVYKK